ncbi:MAG TPA: ZIP family metal transporter, partial [Candidatus Campbellbacteria bacterium]|nr:ZIP family metal transporter [Candidatus Campbellbacteria bacterium]
HNFIDGAIITFAFVADFHLGVIAAFAILLHKIPKEMSDFFVLIHRGYNKKKALVYNFLAATVIIAGAAIAYIFSSKMSFLIGPALGIAAGNFLYIAASDLLPELNAERQKGKTALLQIGFILIGIFIIYFAGINFK